MQNLAKELALAAGRARTSDTQADLFAVLLPFAKSISFVLPVLPVSEGVFLEIGNLLTAGHKNLNFVAQPCSRPVDCASVPVAVRKRDESDAGQGQDLADNMTINISSFIPAAFARDDWFEADFLASLAAAVGECMEPYARCLQESASFFLFGEATPSCKAPPESTTYRRANSCGPDDGGSEDPDQNSLAILAGQAQPCQPTKALPVAYYTDNDDKACMEDKPKPQASRSETPDSVEGPEQNGFWLTFKDVRLEAKFVQWQARLLMWVDVLFLPCLLMTYALLYSAPLYLYAQWPLTWPAPFVPCLAWVLKAAFPQCFQRWREPLLLAVLVSEAGVYAWQGPSTLLALPQLRPQDSPVMWLGRLLFLGYHLLAPLMLLVRFSRVVWAMLLNMAVFACHVPAVAQAVMPGVSHAPTVAGGALIVCGLILPSATLHCLERLLRRSFLASAALR